MKTLYIACSLAGLLALTANAETKLKKEKLQIVFLMGQSNMVGLADPETAVYLTEPAYVPPKDFVTKKSEFFDWQNLYWQGVRTFKGPQKYKDELDALVEERRMSRMKWRQRVKGQHGPWQEAWGKKPEGKGRGVMYPYLDAKAAEEGIYERMDAIIGHPDNEFTVEAAYQELIARDKVIADEIELVRREYLQDADHSDFQSFQDAIKAAKIPRNLESDVEQWRSTYAHLAREHVNLPIAERVHIVAHGHVDGSEGEKNRYTTHGPLSVGFGGSINKIGPEYGIGIALERMVDAPILLVKCSWGNTAIKDAWRPPTLDGVETPSEKAAREAWNKKMAARAEAEGREYTPVPAPKKTGELSYCWGMTLPHIEKVLADPGKYHPEYDPDLGYEIGGMVWFQGYSDQNNPAYGEHLVELVNFMRDQVDTPDMPFVAGTLGMPAYRHMALEGNVNGGMIQAAQFPGMRGTMDVVNTAPYFPLELDMAHNVRTGMDKEDPEHAKAMDILKRATSNKGFHYHGSAKCFLLMGDAMGRSLANLMAGGEPKIFEQLTCISCE
ncbi:sialate O-acetylesterase [Coraliomargarita sinensis]|nr:sialate O-acetylesterase [Coraliomargarita sinensis]